MDVKIFYRHKNKVINMAIVLLALLVSNNIYKRQAADIAQFRSRKDTEIKKNEVLNNIALGQKNIRRLKDIINRKDISRTINTLGDIAKASAVEIISLKPQAEKDDNPVYVKYSFNVVISAADYHSIGKFISTLEKSADIYMVDDMSIELIKEGNKTKHQAGITLSTILIKD